MARGALLAAFALVGATMSGPPAQQVTPRTGAVHDPIPVEPQTSSLGLVLTEYATFPASATTPQATDPRLHRRARINALVELPDGSGRRAVPDLNGTLYLVTDGVPRTYLDVAQAFAPRFFSGRGLGQGFGYVAFHPDFARNGRFYTVHTEDPATNTAVPDYGQATVMFHGVITEWSATVPSADTFAGTRRELLRIGFRGQVHGIQEINFNSSVRRGHPDYGMLYIAVGDGGQGLTGHDPQDLAMPHGKLLRIDPLGTDSPNGKYGIPPDNPYAAQPGKLGEIFASGFRDPHRFSWDRATGRLYVGHIGERAIEAIYEVRPGDNLGWNVREGRYVFDGTAAAPCDRLFPLSADDRKNNYQYPVAEYDHNPPRTWNCTTDVGVAVAGGFVYRGTSVPALSGKYIFGDLVDGRVFFTTAREMRRGAPPATIHRLHLYTPDGRSVTMRQLAMPGATGDTARVDLRFGTDAAGELYILSKANARVWRVTGTRTFGAGGAGAMRVADVMARESWSPVTPARWQFNGAEVRLAEPGVVRPGPRRPFEYAVLTAGPELSSVEFRSQVRFGEPVLTPEHDVIVVFGWRSDEEFYYAHLSTDNTMYAHNGIFKVNHRDRERIDYQWNGRSRGANAAMRGGVWRDIRVRHIAATGEIAVYMDGARDPLMTATDHTFSSGRIGFGSFDATGRLRNLRVTGTPVR